MSSFTEIEDRLNYIYKKEQTKKNTKKYTPLPYHYKNIFNDFYTLIEAKHKDLFNLIKTGRSDDFIRCELNKIYEDNASDELKQKYKKFKEDWNSKKTIKLCNWKRQGIKSADWNTTYNLWLNCKNCEICDYKFLDNSEKRLDHLHNTELIHNIRWVLCNSCNCKIR